MPRGNLKDHYGTLGIRRNATATEIKQAFRVLASELHPDHNPGNKRAEERFKEVQEAYSILSDRDKKRKYDLQRRIFASQNASREHTTARGTRYRQQADETFVREPTSKKSRGNWFSRFFGPLEYQRRLNVRLTLEQAFRGGPTTLPVPGDAAIRVVLPEGIRNNYTIRIKDVSTPPLLVTFQIDEHPVFRLHKNNLILKDALKVDAISAMLGHTYQVPHPGGKPLTITVPPGTQPGTVLRVPGKGARDGDMLVTVEVVIPNNLTSSQREKLRQWAKSAGLP